ncbi:MAG: hypothetical protein GX538_00580 [Gammaproteobacteria bacterium]|nr:hypothetical protein [Gammaproteobacteria bacterium]
MKAMVRSMLTMRPLPRNRAFALVVAIGNAVSSVAWAVVPTVAVIAMVSTWLGNALRIGPPGAYMFMMACAAATAMPRGPHQPGRGGLPGFLEKEVAGLHRALESASA